MTVLFRTTPVLFAASPRELYEAAMAGASPGRGSGWLRRGMLRVTVLLACAPAGPALVLGLDEGEGCQSLSDAYGLDFTLVKLFRHFGDASPDANRQWHSLKCKTHPLPAAPSAMQGWCQRISDRFGSDHRRHIWGFNIEKHPHMKQWWLRNQCETSPTSPAMTQGFGCPAGCKIAVVQSGLLENWIWETLLPSLAEPNPRHTFDYYGLFERKSKAMDSSSGIWRSKIHIEEIRKQKIPTSPDDLGRFRELAQLAPNFNIAALEVVPLWKAAVPRNKAILSGGLGSETQMYHLKETMLRVNLSQPYDFVLRLRDDALFDGPFWVDGIPRGAVSFKPCQGYGGFSDKAWVGPLTEVMRICMDWFTMLYDTDASLGGAEKMLKYVVTRANMTVYWDFAEYTDGAMSKFGLNIADGRRLPAHDAPPRRRRAAATGRKWHGGGAGLEAVLCPGIPPPGPRKP